MAAKGTTAALLTASHQRGGLALTHCCYETANYSYTTATRTAAATVRLGRLAEAAMAVPQAVAGSLSAWGRPPGAVVRAAACMALRLALVDGNGNRW
eukprot:scaffold12973_cov117-Isochrysis_galbana.AAC.7